MLPVALAGCAWLLVIGAGAGAVWFAPRDQVACGACTFLAGIAIIQLVLAFVAGVELMDCPRGVRRGVPVVGRSMRLQARAVECRPSMLVPVGRPELVDRRPVLGPAPEPV